MAKRRDVLKLGPLAFLPAAAAKTLPNGATGAQAAKMTKEPFGDLRIYYEGPTEILKSMTAGSLLLKAGMSPHAPHQHPEEEFMVITEGTGEISVEGKVTKVGPGSMMYCGANKPHGIVNTGKTPLLFYFYKWM
ncbi:MAG: cupin domain-containing protein [Bryobacteraceae bacterium]